MENNEELEIIDEKFKEVRQLQGREWRIYGR